MSKKFASKLLYIVNNSLEMYEEDEKRINMEKEDLLYNDGNTLNQK